MKIYDVNGNELNFINLIHEFIEAKSKEHGIDINNVMLGVCDEHGGLQKGVSPNLEVMELGEYCFDGYNINSIEVINSDSKPEEQRNIPVLFFTIKNDIGWSKWCDITGGNHYALNEGYCPNLNEVFYCTKSQAEQLGVI